jgi:hypothetical protein
LPDVSDLANLTAAQGIKLISTYQSGGGYYNIQGLTVTDVGDLNGDGLDDVAIASNLGVQASVFVLYGSTAYTGSAANAAPTFNLSPATMSGLPGGGFAVAGTGTSNSYGGLWLGQSVAGVDLNGDGYNDLLIGAPSYGTSNTSMGSVYVIYGGPAAQGNVTITGGSTATTNGTVNGAANGSAILSGTNGLGTNMQAVGDVNGDGYTDYLITAPSPATSPTTATGSGMAYLVFGGPNGLAQPGTTAIPISGITITATNTNEQLGGSLQATQNPTSGGGNFQQTDAWYAQQHSVASLGNIDGSGNTAFAIGSPGAINPVVANGVSEGAGAVYVFQSQSQSNWANITLPTYSGGAWTNLTGSNSLTSAGGFVIYSSSFAAKAAGGTTAAALANVSDLGFAISSAGDVNGDGITDFLIGAPMANGGQGAVFLVFGEAGGLPTVGGGLTGSSTSSGVVDLDALVQAGQGLAFGTPGTAVEYIGNQSGSTTAIGSAMGTDVTGGDYNGSGISGYSLGAWGQTVGGVINAGQIYTYNGTTALLTQPYSNADNAVYYAGDNPTSSNPGLATMNAGVDLIATGAGNNDWVHGIGMDSTGTQALTVQHDAVDGGAGDDYVGIVSTIFTSVSGGNGWNTLVFEGSNIFLNLTQMGLLVHGFMEFDLNNQSNNTATDPRGLFIGEKSGNTLSLGLSDVLSQANDTVTGSTQHMTILGDSGSTVALEGSTSLSTTQWATNSTYTDPVSHIVFDVYHNTTMGSSTVADLLIEQGVHVI